MKERVKDRFFHLDRYNKIKIDCCRDHDSRGVVILVSSSAVSQLSFMIDNLEGMHQFPLTLSLPTGQVYRSYTYCNLFDTMTGLHVFRFPTFLWLSRTCDVMEFFSIVANQVSRLFLIIV